MSRSVSVPTSLSPSTIGASPTPSSFIILAAYATGFSASIAHGFGDIRSLIFFAIGLLPYGLRVIFDCPAAGAAKR
jgi:hypothetical protein